MKIPFGRPLIDHKEIKLVNEVLRSPILTHGEKAITFEKEFSKFTNCNNCTTTSSCTSALHLSYLAIGLTRGDEVILPAQTHVATAHTIEITGAKPVFVDADNNGNIDINLIEQKINKKTKCITIVHFLGLPVDMYKILKLAKKIQTSCSRRLCFGFRRKNRKKTCRNFWRFWLFLILSSKTYYNW